MTSKSKQKRRRPRPSRTLTHCVAPGCDQPIRAGEQWVQIGTVERAHLACVENAAAARKGTDSERAADGVPVPA